MQVAESKGLPKLKYHLLPRTKGFWVTVQNLRGTGELCKFGFANQKTFPANCCHVCCGAAAAVYDSSLNFRNNQIPTFLDVLNGRKYHADLYVRLEIMIFVFSVATFDFPLEAFVLDCERSYFPCWSQENTAGDHPRR